MIIIVHGENNFFTKRKTDEIIAQYKTKHPQGLSLFVFDEESDVVDIRGAIETLSLFEKKKLIVCKDLLGVVTGNNGFVAWLKEKRVKEANDIVVVFSERAKKEAKKNKNMEWLLAEPAMVQESVALTPAQFPVWIKKEAAALGAEIRPDAVQALLVACGSDQWRIFHELQKLSSYRSVIDEDAVKTMVARDPEGQIFEAASALVNKQGKKAAEHFSALTAQGEEWPMMFGMIVYQFRSMVRVKDCLERGLSPDAMAKELGMHPFAVKKTIPLVKGRPYDELVRKFGDLRDMDHALKTGGLTFDAAWERLLLS